MAGNSFVNRDRSRIHCRRAPEVTEFARKLWHVTDAVLSKSRWTGEVIVFAKPERAQIFRRRSKRIMSHPLRDSENATFLEKFSDLKFLIGCVFDPRVDVGRDFK